MKAAQLVGPRNFEIVDVPQPEVRAGNCLVQIESWSICGSDIRNTYGTVLPEEEYPKPIGHPGHEIAGTVVESFSNEFDEGDRVIVLPMGDIGLVEYMEALPGRMIRIPDESGFHEWLMCQPSGTVLYACQQIGTLMGKNVAVIGQGAIGLSFTAMIARSGAKTLIAADLFDYRLDYSKKFGATHVVNPSKEPLQESVTEILGGEQPDVIIEAAGYPDSLHNALNMVKSYGTVVMFGIQQRHPEQDFVVEMDCSGFRNRNAILVSIAAGHTKDVRTHIETMIELKQRGWWDPAEMITHRLKFDDVKQAYDMYTDRDDGVVKVVMGR